MPQNNLMTLSDILELNVFSLVLYFTQCIWGRLWRRKWQPTPVFLPGKSHGRRRLEGYRLWDLKELETTEWLHIEYRTTVLVVTFQSTKSRKRKSDTFQLRETLTRVSEGTKKLTRQRRPRYLTQWAQTPKGDTMHRTSGGLKKGHLNQPRNFLQAINFSREPEFRVGARQCTFSYLPRWLQVRFEFFFPFLINEEIEAQSTCPEWDKAEIGFEPRKLWFWSWRS